MPNITFEQIKNDTALVSKGGLNGAAIASLGKKDSIAGFVIVNPVTSGSFTITDSKTGIYTEYSSLYSDQVHMTRMETGVLSTYCKDLLQTEVTYCNIDANRYGIFWTNNIGAKKMLALGNQIFMDGTNTVGISVKETNNAATSNYLVQENYISVLDGKAAISGTTLKAALITGNVIHLAGTPQITMTGIVLEDGDSTFINCNTIGGDDNNDTLKTGISVSISRQTQVGCNSTDSTGFGFFFGGVSPATSFKGNTINNHFDGLRMNSVAVIDTQSHSGNKWIGNYGNFGAVNLNAVSSQNLLASLFEVNPTPDPLLLPSSPTTANFPAWPDNAGWFDVLPSGTAFDCITNSVCGSSSMMGGDGGSESLKLLIANDSTLTTDFIPESKSMARQYLYSELQADSSLITGNPAFNNFVAIHVTNATGKLFEAKKAVKEAYQGNSMINDSLITLYNICHFLRDSIYSLDSLELLYPGSYGSIRESLTQNFHSAQFMINATLEQQRIYKTSKLTIAAQQNALVLPDETPEVNEKIVNELELLYIAYGLDTVAIYENQLLVIASQCPYLGGTSVYRARVLVSLLYNSIIFDDQSECASQGIYRSIHNSGIPAQNVTLIPNPADGSVIVSIKGFENGICKRHIKNVINQEVGTYSFNCSDNYYWIDISSFSPGVYTVDIIIDDEINISEKLIIVR